MPRSSAVVTATTDHLLRRRSRFVLGADAAPKPSRTNALKPMTAPVR
ncbi:hypothetical protein [Luteipulveratus halotolerans]|nr:hypothetical protein [Luteipulveratus halotolerans]